jgi:hypothetical protein
MTTEEKLKEMGLWDRYQKVNQPTDQPTGQTADQTAKPEQTTLQEIQNRINEIKAQVPTVQSGVEQLSADQLEDTGDDVDIPDGDTKDANEAITQAGSVSDMMNAVLGQQKEQQEFYQKQFEQSQKQLTEAVEGRTGQADILKQQMEEWGVKDIFKQIQDITALTVPLQEQLSKIDLQQQNELDALRERTGGLTWATREEANVVNKYNRMKAPIAAQLNAYASQAQALQGNLSIANQFATQAVNAATYDQEFDYNVTRDFIQMNQDFINNLNQNDQQFFNTLLQLKGSELEQARNDKSFVMEGMRDYPNAGITVNDTIEQATIKASAWSGKQPSEFELWKQKVDYEAGVTAGALSDNQKASLLALIAEIPSYPDKETALEDLEANKTSIILQVGEGGYSQLVDEVDKKLESRKEEEPKASLKKRAATFGETLRYVPKTFLEGSWKGIKGMGETAGSFFSGLFGQ